MTDMADLTDQQILEELQRERTMRSQVFPRLVNEGKLSHEDAQHRMAVIARLILEYQAKASKQAELDLANAPAKPVVTRAPWQLPERQLPCPKCGDHSLVRVRLVEIDDKAKNLVKRVWQHHCQSTRCEGGSGYVWTTEAE